MAEERDYTTLFEIAGMDVPAFWDPAWTPEIPAAFADADPDVFALIRQGDILVHPASACDCVKPAGAQHHISRIAELTAGHPS